MSRPPVRQHRFHSVREVASQLGVSTKTVSRWIAAGTLHRHKVGRQIRVSDEDLEAFLATNRR